MIYRLESEARKKHSEEFSLLDRENHMQYPNAKFVIATYFPQFMSDNEYELSVFFDIGKPEKYLWTTVPIIIDDLSDPYIDEYYEVSKKEALKLMNNILKDNSSDEEIMSF